MSESPGTYTTKTSQTTAPSNDIERAAAQLGRSETGRQAARDLLQFLQNSGLSLDSSNQLAVLTLLRGAWTTSPGSVRDLLADLL